MIHKCPERECWAILDMLEERFGIDRKLLNDFSFFKGMKGRMYLGPNIIPPRPKPVSLGMVVARMHGSVKPSTNILQMLGKHATKNIVGLSKEEAVKFIRGEDLDIKETEATHGYVLVKYYNFPLGCGLLKEDGLKNMLPKARRLEVDFI